jgi:TM2 domain-containing membrane protein YozV
MSAGDMNSHAMYIRLRGRIAGPYDVDQLIALHQRGQFSRVHEVSVDRQNWRSASTLEHVFQSTMKRSPNFSTSNLFGDDPIISSASTRTETGKSAMPIWHYNIGDEALGPVSLTKLKDLATAGQVNANDLVWKAGMANWVPAGDVEELESLFIIQIASPTRSTREQRSSASKQAQAATSGAQVHYCYACGCPTDSRAEICPKCGTRQPNQSITTKNKVVAALFAFLLGGVGAHHFYLGNIGIGVVYLLFFWTAIPMLVAFVEAIMYLCMTDAQFAVKYAGR